MKVLCIFQRMPWPLLDGYALRTFNFAQELSRVHDLNMFTFNHDRELIPKNIGKIFRRIQCNRFQEKDLLPSGGFLSPYRLHAVDTNVIQKLLQFSEEEEYSLIWMSGWQTAVFSPYLHKKPLFFDLIDDLVLTEKRGLRRKGFLGKLQGLRWLFISKRYEEKYLTRMSFISVASKEDANSCSKYANGRDVVSIPNGVNTEFYSFDEENEGDGLVFEGDMGFLPNADGALYLVNDIMPIVWKEFRNLKITIVGKNPTEKVKCLAKDPRVFVTGYVDDIRPFVRSANIFLCPLRCGAGIKNKILQAWSMGKAVVTTSISSGGLRIERDNIVIADGAREFAEAIISLLKNRERIKELGKAGRRTVEKYYTWNIQAKLIDDIWIKMNNNRESM